MPESDRDRSHVGAAFVSGSAVLIAVASWLLAGSDRLHLFACAVAAGMVIFAIAAAWLLPHDRGVLVHPVIVFGGVATLGAISTSFGTAYGGLFTIAFIYLGLCGTRRQIYVATPLAVAAWLLANGAGSGSISGSVVVRLPIALIIWLTVGLLLSQHTRRVNDQTSTLQDQAHRDPMTGLHNRRALADLSKSAAAGDAVVLLDLDHFKAVNDTYGHLVGDTVLCDFADTLAHSLRAGDSAVRYGGEEFLLFLPRTTTEQLGAILERVQATWAARSPMTTFSAGAALIEPERGIIQALGFADRRLYAAKEAGRNRCIVDGAGAVKPTDENVEQSTAAVGA